MQVVEPVQSGPQPSIAQDPAESQPVRKGLFCISDLCEILEEYLDRDDIKQVYRAYLFGAAAHEGQQRKSGEPYIYHPLEVARILAEMRLDHRSIMAAILHDVIEDTPTAKEQLASEFGDDVAELVDGVSKLTQMHFESRAEAQAANFRKMVLAMAQDIRVILIKLADRLHNMRTLGALNAEKRRRIARETLEIYSPIANRLGMNTIRLELEDLGFRALYPMRYRVLDEMVRKARGNRKEIVQKIETSLINRLEQEAFDCQVVGRQKHLYGIYQKMRTKGLSFSEVLDIYAFRIIVDEVDTCYRVLGAVHNLYKPVPGRFKDYIAIPKANGYQSLHTVLFGPYGVLIEVQIRTAEMDRAAEVGIAAHWLYKTGEEPGSSVRAQARARAWLHGLLEMQKNAGNSLEFIENVKVDLFPDEVYVFTPKGEILALPRGATAVDMAYAIHTDVGNRCIAAKVDRRPAPLSTPLRNGQTVEIVTSPDARPNPAWLDYAITAKARSNIRHYLKNLRREEAVALGRRLLERVLQTQGRSLEDVSEGRTALVLEELGLASFDDLLADVGLGNRLAVVMARRLLPELEAHEPDTESERTQPDRPSGPLAIKGTEGMLVSFAKCCRPIPGDRIIGHASPGRGIVIHRRSCRNVMDYQRRPEDWIDVQWEPEVEAEFPVELRLQVANQRGVLASVAAVISEMDSNIENVVMDERDGVMSTLSFRLSVRNRKHMAHIMRRLRALGTIARIWRIQS